MVPVSDSIREYQNFMVNNVVRRGDSIPEPLTTSIHNNEKYDIASMLKMVHEMLLNHSLSNDEKRVICDLTNAFLLQFHCGICNQEKFEALSIGMMRYYCGLNKHITTRYFDEVNNQIACSPKHCPVRKYKYLQPNE